MTTTTRPVLRGFVRVLSATTIAVAALGTAQYVMQVAAAGVRVSGWNIVTLVLLSAGGPAAGSLALMLAWKSWDRQDARVLATFLALLSYTLAGEPLWSLLNGSDLPRLLVMCLDTLFPVAAVAGMAVMMRFSAVFPHPLAPDDVRARGGSRLGVALAAAQRWTLDPVLLRRAALWFCGVVILLPQAAKIAVFAATGSTIPLVDVAKQMTVAVLVATLVLTPANLLASYRRASTADRRRIFWVMEGFLLAGAVVGMASALKVLQNVTGYTVAVRFWFPLALLAGFFGLLVCLAIAMFGAGALDPALAVRRTAVTGIVGLVLLVMFAALEQTLQGVLGQWLGLSDRAGGIINGVAVGAAFEPVRARTAGWVEAVLRRWSGDVPQAVPAAPPLTVPASA